MAFILMKILFQMPTFLVYIELDQDAVISLTLLLPSEYKASGVWDSRVE